MTQLKDRDPWETDIPRFCSANDHDIGKHVLIFQSYMDNPTQHVYPIDTEATANTIFMDRLAIQDRTALSHALLQDNLHVDQCSLDTVIKKACSFFGPEGSETHYYRKLNSDKQRATETLKQYYDRMEQHFRMYILFLNSRLSVDFNAFLAPLLDGALAQEQVILEQAMAQDELTTAQQLEIYIGKRKRLWESIRNGRKNSNTKKEPQGTSRQGLNTHHAAPNQSDSFEERITQNLTNSMSKMLNETSSSIQQKVLQSLNNIERKVHEQDSRITGLETMMKSNSHELQKQALNNMWQQRCFGGQHHQDTSYLNFMSNTRQNYSGGDQQRGERERRFEPRGRSRSPERGRTGGQPSRSRSRSPSPHEGCHGCGEEHFSIQCPYKTNEERELKLFYKVYSGRLGAEEEAQLRRQHNLENLPENRYKIAKKQYIHIKVGDKKSGYCHWCNTKKFHNTIYCDKYCPLCKQEGHWWGQCSRETERAQKRLRHLARELEQKKL
jgi:hypothetical protein